jgi:ribosome-associated heat shock protein Hsp15
MRIDKLLWFLRFSRTRGLAQRWVEAGHIRRNGQRVEKPGQRVASGDVLTLPLRERVLVIELAALPERRGPALEAQSCYRVLDAGGSLDQSAGGKTLPEGEDQQ